MRKSLILAVSFLGLFDSLYLWWVYTSPARPLVCLGTGCDVVRASRYAHLWGAPLPSYGAEMYGVLVLLVFAQALAAAPSMRRLAGILMAVVSGLGLLFSIYLTGLEAFVIHAWCAWCVTSALAVALIFVLAVWDLASPEPAIEPGRALGRLRGYFVILIIAVAAGVPAFIHLQHSGESAPMKAASEKALEEHLIRPDSHSTGDAASPVTLVEFGDFECPACGLAERTVQAVRARYGDRIRFVFRQFPLVQIHPYAETAAVASECAAEQGKFWQAYDKFYQEQDDLSEPALDRYAAELGLDTRQFDQCLTSDPPAARVKRDMDDGKALGIDRTPTFFLGHQEMVGPPELGQLSLLIDRQLAEHGESAASTSVPHDGKASAGDSPGSAPSGSAVAQGFGDGSGLGGPSPGANAFAQLGSSPLACSPDEARQKQPALIHTADARQLFEQKKAVFVDVRSAQDFASRHIPGARNIPVERIEQQWSSLPNDKIVVLYEAGRRGASPDDACAMSRGAARVLLAHGFAYDNVKVYQEGLTGWQKASLPSVP